MPQTNGVTDFELNSWLSEIAADGSLSSDEVKQLGTILGNDKVQTKLRDQVLMRRDYSRKTQELAGQRKQVEQDVETILAERADLAKWKSGVDAQLKKAYTDLDSERLTSSQFEARIRTIADQQGLDANELLKGIKAAKTATGDAAADAARNGGNNGGGNGVPVNFDPTKFVPADDFSRFARQSPLLMAEIADIADEHEELTGKPFRMTYKDQGGKEWTGRRALLVKTAEHNVRPGNRSMSVRDMWEADFNIPAVRQEQVRESIRNEERGKLDAEYRTKFSGDMVNGTPNRAALANQPKSVLFEEKRDHRTPAERDVSQGDKPGAEPVTNSPARDMQRFQRTVNSFAERRAAGVPMGQPAPEKGAGAL